MSAAAPPLAADLAAGLRRLKLSAIRQLAPELLITARAQRWAPEELLRTLIEAEITARDASNARTRMKTAAFPVTKTLDELDRSACSIPGPTLDYLATLEWITAKENLCLVGPGRHRQEPRPGRPRHRRGPRRAQGPVLHRRRPDRDPLPRPGRQLRRPRHRQPAPQRPHPGRRNRVRAARRHRRPAAIPVRLRRLRTPLTRHRKPLAVRILGPVPARAHHRRQPPGPPAPPRERRRHSRRFPPDAPGPSQRRNHPEQDLTSPRGGDF